MKAVTIWQPHASLCAAGVKRYETRSWAAYGLRIGEDIAIHAAKKVVPVTDIDWEERISIIALFGHRPEMVAYGAVVAIARFEGNYRAEDVPDPDPYGNYRPGRWAWRLGNVRELEHPCPARGRERLWEWSPPWL